MAECHRPMMGIALFKQYMAIEAAHFPDGKYADAAEAAGGHGQHFALGDIAAKIALAIALEPEEGNIAGGNIPFQGAPGEIRFAARRLQQTMLNELIFHRPLRAHLAGGRIAAMEAHEGIGELIIKFPLNLCRIQRSGHGIIDIQQRYRIPGNAGADIFGKRAVNIHLAGHRDPPGCQPGIDIAGLKAKGLRESGPAFIRKGHEFPIALVAFRPIQQRQFKLGHALQQIIVIFALAHFLFHILADSPDARIFGMGLIAHQQIQFAVFFHFHPH